MEQFKSTWRLIHYMEAVKFLREKKFGWAFNSKQKLSLDEKLRARRRTRNTLRMKRITHKWRENNIEK